jgi:hypothetical protein
MTLFHPRFPLKNGASSSPAILMVINSLYAPLGKASYCVKQERIYRLAYFSAISS